MVVQDHRETLRVSELHASNRGRSMTDNEVGRFFDTLTRDYTATIERCFPRYREMLWAVLEYLPETRPVKSVLELGCGTGNLSVLLHEAFPDATLKLVDVSGESLDICRSRLAASDTIEFEQRDFRKLTYETAKFDLITSSISIHHLASSEKQDLFRQCHGWLKDDGVLCFADQCAGATADLYDKHMRNWRDLSFNAGSTKEEWDMWMRHQAEHDHHDTLFDQLDWLRKAGFSIVDCPWRYLLWSVIQARK
jgi:tRNA (cmo5U34)-methyltransferase